MSCSVDGSDRRTDRRSCAAASRDTSGNCGVAPVSRSANGMRGRMASQKSAFGEPYWWEAAPREEPTDVALPAKCDVAWSRKFAER